MKWVHWYNKDRLHGAIGFQTPNEKENAFHQQNNELEKSSLSAEHKTLRNPRGASQQRKKK